MKRITMLVVAVVFCAFASVASVASAHPGVSSSKRAAVVKTHWEKEYDASGYYGNVKCTGITTVNKKYPGGREVEHCEAVGGTLEHMKAGKGQVAFENSEGGFVNEWESDSGSGKKTTNYSYSVNSKLTKFKLIAIYAPPVEETM